jgi:acyl-CoA thioesterase-1
MKKISSAFISTIVAIFLSCHGARAQMAPGVAQQTVDPAAYNHPVRVACLGDSITMGVGTLVPAKESYPAQLQAILGPKWEVTNFGVGGRTLLRKADPFSIGRGLAAKPDVVVILLGTNDSRQATWDKFGTDFVGDYSSIIDQLARLDTHPKIWICIPPPMFPGRWNLSEDVLTAKTIPAIKEVAKAKNVPLIDLHTPLMDQKANFADTVHPNPKVARRIAEIVAAALTGSAPAGM